MQGESITGKRSEVRNNSRQAVDDSARGLRVGPTTSATADRKSEACPPDLLTLSQRKSRRESESGAFSVAREASDVLRSEATQQGSFLDRDQINRNNTHDVVFCNASIGRGKSCGRYTLIGKMLDGTRRYVRVDCKCWGCRYCGPKKARGYRSAISAVAQRLGLNRFLTLTIDSKLIEDQDPVAYINAAFAKWRVYLKREFRISITYIRILELLLSAPKRSRRITVSRGICLIEKHKSVDLWNFYRVPILNLFLEFLPGPEDVFLDEEGVLKEFQVKPPGFDGLENTNGELVQ